MGTRKVVCHYIDHTENQEVLALCGEKIIIGGRENKVAFTPQEDMDKKMAVLNGSQDRFRQFGYQAFTEYLACDNCKAKRSIWDLAQTDL